MFLTGIQRLVHYGFKALVESLHHTRPFLFALGNLIEVVLHLGSEVIVHDFLKVIHQEVVHHDTDICRQQFSLIRADQFLANRLLDLLALQRVDGVSALLTLLIAFMHVVALLDGGNGGGIG